MNALKKQSETRVNALKLEASDMEVELEEVRYEASFAGGQSRDAYQKHKELAAMQQKYRRVKERMESAEQLQQRVTAGLNHICELLGVPLRGEDAAVVDIIHDVESVLETVIEEREKGNAASDSPAFGRTTNRENSAVSCIIHLKNISDFLIILYIHYRALRLITDQRSLSQLSLNWSYQKLVLRQSFLPVQWMGFLRSERVKRTSLTMKECGIENSLRYNHKRVFARSSRRRRDNRNWNC